MKSITKIIVSYLVLTLFMVAFVQQASAKEWASQTIEDVNKAWKVRFNQPIQQESLTSDTIYIQDGENKLEASLKLMDNGYAVEVTPLTPYELGKAYRLEITGNIKSANDGKFLKTPITVPFDVVDPSAPIQSTRHVTGEGLTSFTVMARPDVHKVTINGTALHLTGKDKYTHTFIGLKPGSTVTIKAYSETNRTLETKSYTIGE